MEKQNEENKKPVTNTENIDNPIRERMDEPNKKAYDIYATGDKNATFETSFHKRRWHTKKLCRNEIYVWITYLVIV